MYFLTKKRNVIRKQIKKSLYLKYKNNIIKLIDDERYIYSDFYYIQNMINKNNFDNKKKILRLLNFFDYITDCGRKIYKI